MSNITLPIQINYAPILVGNSATTSNYIGVPAIGVTGQRGILPTFTTGTAGNSLYVSLSTGSDLNDGLSPATAYQHLETTTDTIITNMYDFTAPTANSGISYLDLSGHGNNLLYVNNTTSNDSFQTKHASPEPIDGNGYFACDTSQGESIYLPTAVMTGLTGRTGCTIDFAFNMYASGTTTHQQLMIGTATTGLTATSGLSVFLSPVSGQTQIGFYIAGNGLTTSTANIQANTWYRCACVYQSGVTNGQQIWLGVGNEPLQQIAQQTLSVSIPALTGLGFAPQAFNLYQGNISRPVISNVAQTTLPTPLQASGVIGAYEFQSQPKIITSNKNYVVVTDSSEYQTEFKLDKWRWDLPATNFSGLYASDGSTPTISNRRGVLTNTFGAGASLANTTLPAALPASGLSYYLNKTNGNDATGQAGNPAKPFKTLAACITNGGSSNKFMYITDSAIYTESLTDTTNNAIIATAGNNPILKPSTSVHFNVNNGAWIFQGVTLNAALSGGASTNSLINSSNTNPANFYFKNCTISGYNYLIPGNILYGFFYFNSCYISLCNSLAVNSGSWAGYQNIFMDNTYWAISNSITNFNSMFLTRTTINIAKNSNVTLNLSSFLNLKNSFWLCDFIGNGSLNIGLGNTNYGKSYIDFDNCHFGINTTMNDNSATISVCNFIGIRNCVFEGNTNGLSLVNSNGTSDVFCINNSIFNNNSSNGLQATAGGGTINYRILYNNIFSNNATWGYLTNTTGAHDFFANNTFIANASGSTSSTTSGTATWINNEYAPSYVSTTVGDENFSFVPSSNDILSNNAASSLFTGETSLGKDSEIVSLSNPNLTINGFTFLNYGSTVTPVIQGSNGLYLKAGTVAYCTFNGLENYAIKNTSNAATINNCYFYNNYGFDVLAAALGTNISYCSSWGNNDACLELYNSNITAKNITCYGAGYGVYALPGITTNLTNSIFSNCGTYDVSVDNPLFYVCAKTLDPSRLGYLDPNTSINLNPLFQFPVPQTVGQTPNLLLKSIAAGYPINSPVIQRGSDGNDLGCYITTYSTGSTAWTNINFGTAGYWNPDTIDRSILLVNPANGQVENGRTYSQFSAQKVHLDLSWGEENPMSKQMLLALQSLYTCGNANIQVQNLYDNAGNMVQDGLWYPAYLDISQAFEWSEPSSIGFTTTAVLTPLKVLSINMA